MSLRQLREAAGMSVAAVARYVGTSESLVRRWEAGSVTPGMGSAVKLARILGVGLEDVARACSVA